MFTGHLDILSCKYRVSYHFVPLSFLSFFPHCAKKCHVILQILYSPLRLVFTLILPASLSSLGNICILFYTLSFKSIIELWTLQGLGVPAPQLKIVSKMKKLKKWLTQGQEAEVILIESGFKLWFYGSTYCGLSSNKLCHILSWLVCSFVKWKKQVFKFLEKTSPLSGLRQFKPMLSMLFKGQRCILRIFPFSENKLPLPFYSYNVFLQQFTIIDFN